MITITDDERDTALRAARYTIGVMRRWLDSDPGAGAHAEQRANITKLEALIRVLEQESSIMRNGVWRCLCPNPWRHPDCLVCLSCGAAVPT